MITTKEKFINPFSHKQGKKQNLNLQYSLSLIEASLEYLTNIEDQISNKKKAKEMPLEELISPPQEESSIYSCSKEMLKELLRDHERIIIQLKNNSEYYSKKFGYTTITDSVNRIIKEHQRITWQLRSCF
jgi:hypothetical protein